MKATGKTKFKTDLFSFGIQKNGGIAPLIIDSDEWMQEDEFRKVKYEPDNKAIREYLGSGASLPWARIGERGERLVIK